MIAATTMAGEKVRPLRGAAIGRGTTMTGCCLLDLAALAAPLEQDVVRIEAEVQRVVAQEALGVDRPGQLLVVAPLEGGQVACPDLRVALGAVQIHALALAGREQPLGQVGTVVGRGAAHRLAAVDADRTLHLVSRGHSSSPSSPAPAGDGLSRRSTARAFDPSKAPIYPRASSWSIIRAARA